MSSENAMEETISFENWDLKLFDSLLQQNVANGVVNYPGFQNSPDFNRFIEQIGRVDRATLVSREQKLSFYINAYNALVIRGIIDGLSPASFFGRLRFFVFRKYRIAGERLSLLSIEHRRIIPLGDPRSHFAINCASASCPILSNNTFRSDQLEDQLEGAARHFVRSSTQLGKQQEISSTSRIFKWYRREFESTGGGLQGFLARYLEPRDDGPATDVTTEPAFDRYDWSLNGRPPE